MTRETTSETFPFASLDNPFRASNWAIKEPRAPTLASTNPAPPAQAEKYISFHQFASLPAELRLRIWAFDLPSPQTLHIYYGARYVKKEEWSLPGWVHRRPWVFENGLKICNLEICQESRSEAVKAGYEKVRVGGETRWFNYDIDILFLNVNHTVLSAVHVTFEPAGFRGHYPIRLGDMRRAKFLALGNNFWDCVRWHGDHEIGGGHDVACMERRQLGLNLFEFGKKVERLVISYTGDPLDFDKSAKYKISFETEHLEIVEDDFKLPDNVVNIEVEAWNLEKNLRFKAVTEDQRG